MDGTISKHEHQLDQGLQDLILRLAAIDDDLVALMTQRWPNGKITRLGYRRPIDLLRQTDYRIQLARHVLVQLSNGLNNVERK